MNFSKKDARRKFNDIILYVHYLSNDSLYSDLVESPYSAGAAIMILVLLMFMIGYFVPSYTLAYLLLGYFSGRLAFEVLRLKVNKRMVENVETLRPNLEEIFKNEKGA